MRIIHNGQRKDIQWEEPTRGFFRVSTSTGKDGVVHNIGHGQSGIGGKDFTQAHHAHQAPILTGNGHGIDGFQLIRRLLQFE